MSEIFVIGISCFYNKKKKIYVYDKMKSYQDFLTPLHYLPLLAKLRQNTIRKTKNVNLENKISKEF